MTLESSGGEKQRMPQQAQTLIRNLKRRRGLLARVSGKEISEIPDILIKDTLLRFLDKKYKGLEKTEVADINNRIFILLNRAASLVENKQDTSPVTAMYGSQYKGARRLTENSLRNFKNEVIGIIKLCRENNVSLKSITGMQSGLGVPKVEELDKLLKWSKDNGVDLKSITGMQSGLGAPKVEELDKLMTWLNRKDVKYGFSGYAKNRVGKGIPATYKDFLDSI